MTEEETSVIHSYLASFNREIESNEIEDENEPEPEESKKLYSHSSDDELLDEDSCEGGDLAIHRETEKSGYYYKVPIIKQEPKECLMSPASKRKAAEIIRLDVKKEDVNASQSGETPIPSEELQSDDEKALELVAQMAENAVASNVIGEQDAYQTVTVVPSDTNPGELSYVLFVSKNGSCVDAEGNPLNLDLYDLVDVNDTESFDDSFLTKQVKQTVRFAARRRGSGRQKHRCSFCSYSNTKKYLLLRHLKSHSDERPHQCGICTRGFKTLASLQNHVNTHTGTRPHSCKECDSSFTTSGELVRHIRYKHTHEKPHKCTECDYASVELSKLKRHIRCHTGERPYQCPHCTYASPDTYKLKRHLRIHTGEKPYECDICQARFTQSNSLKAHRLIHLGSKPVFHCDHCPTTCGRKTDLKIHMQKLHSCDKSHQCTRCGKVFLDRYSYKIHIRTHEGEKCYKCDLCSYASTTPTHLEAHMLVHTDQKPFKCDECDQSFRQKQLLKRHRNIHHDPSYVPPTPKEKPHVCVLCGKAFRHKGNLIRHFVFHDPEASVSEKDAAQDLGEMKTDEEELDKEEEESLEDSLKEDDQVVVFEVIQIPSTTKGSSDEPITIIESNPFLLSGADGQSYSIIEPADDSVNNLFSFESTLSESEDVENISSLSYGNENIENIEVGTSKTSKKRFKSQSYTKSARKSITKNPRILKAFSDKERFSLNSVSLSIQDEVQVTKGKETEQTKEILRQDYEECFGLDDKGEALLVLTEAGYSAFSSTLDPDIS